MLIALEVAGKGKALLELDDRNPNIAEKIYRSLPLEAMVHQWKEEVYFEIHLNLEDQNPSPTAEKGDVSYWSPGKAFCIFFGRSQPISPVNHIGRIWEGIELFSEVEEGEKITLRRTEGR
jgi:hypothetical protein